MEPIFALDIGTRMVMGLLMTKNNDQAIEIVASARTEHRQRAMYDGQVHDVDEVARAVLQVKESLEKKCNVTLRRVAVAAAGRALKTEVAAIERKELLPIRWERDDVLALEMEAVHQALRQLESSEVAEQRYHCVGYNTVAKWIEGEEIANLIGQRGRIAKVSVIATFLPRTVVDGLVAVLGRAGLEMTSLTLEPIAAGQAAIPANMRRLNLALVDVGAGTADIALTRNGSFFAYGMVPMAGDEITEAICTQYLLDFQVGEKVKRDLHTKAQLSFKDFLGAKVVVDKDDILKVIFPAVRTLAERVAKEILRLNTGVPQAIILIGGGSLTPMFVELLAEIMGIPQNRVGIQVRERLNDILGEKTVKGPESITPIGIGIAAMEERGLQYYTVMVNGTPIPIFELQLTTVAEALLAAGIQPRSFLGKPGAALTYEWNGEMRVLRGSLGSSAQLWVNGESGKLDQALNPGDELTFKAGEPGQDAQATLSDVLPPSENKRLTWNGEPEEYGHQVFVNGQRTNDTYILTDGDKITDIPNDDLFHLLTQKEVAFEEQDIKIQINGETRMIPVIHEIRVNGQVVHSNVQIQDGDAIEFHTKQMTVGDLELQAQALIFYFNGREVKYPPSETFISERGRRVSNNELITDGMVLRIEGFKHMPILSELLPYVQLPDQGGPGAVLKISVNGLPAEFTTVLHPGDRISVTWA